MSLRRSVGDVLLATRMVDMLSMRSFEGEVVRVPLSISSLPILCSCWAASESAGYSATQVNFVTVVCDCIMRWVCPCSMDYAGLGASVPGVGKFCITVSGRGARDCGAWFAHGVEKSVCWRAIKILHEPFE